MAIKPELPGGFRDYLPPTQQKRIDILVTLEKLAEIYGFQPLGTPSIEKKKILTGADPEFEKELIEIERPKNKESWALRFDQTVSLSRAVAKHPQEIEMPFKRYQFGKVWRGEKPQKGRYREFYQFDVDIVSTSRITSEAEIISFIYESLKKLGIDDFKIFISSRKVLDGLPGLAGFDPEINPSVLRSIDKLDKKDWVSVEKELSKKGLDSDQISHIKEFLDIQSESVEEYLGTVKDFMKDQTDVIEGVEELEQLVEYLSLLEVEKSNFEIDFSIARGLDYYTGPVFETVLENSGVGSIFSGGRYDDLIERFSSTPVPSVGASLGVDRLVDALSGMDKSEMDFGSRPSVLVLDFDEDCTKDCLEFVSKLRKEGIDSQVYLGQENSLTGQLSYGASREFRVVVIYGSDEKEKGVVQLRDMDEESQIEVAEDELVSAIKNILTEN
ncbi:MAG: histidine--tRNA ligase [Candidatus Magasanikbacteria bacterium]